MTRQDNSVEWGDDDRRYFTEAVPVLWALLAWGVFVALVVYAALQRGGR